MVVINADFVQKIISERQPIGEGRYRKVYSVDGMAIKVPKQRVEKDYGIMRVHYPAGPYVRAKFRISDFNEAEYRNYCGLIARIPSEYRDCFEQIQGVIKLPSGSASICSLITNDDGSLASTMKQSGKINDARFWQRLHDIEGILRNEKIYLFGIDGKDVVVRNSREGATPVFVDYKRIGGRTYPFQPWLMVPSMLDSKLKRRFEYLRTQYQS